MHAISIVIPVWNEEKNIAPLVERIHGALKKRHIQYEIIFIDDHSRDNTRHIIKKLSKTYPISLSLKQGKRGKAYSLAEGFAKAKYQTLAMIDADLQYPPEALPEFLKKITDGADIVVAKRTHYKVSKLRRFISNSFRSLFGRVLFGLEHDVQAGLKVFTKETYETVKFNPTAGWAFDLEFLHRAKQAGCSIENYEIIFEKRQNGESKISFFRASLEIGLNALLVKAKQVQPQHILPKYKNSMRGAGVGFKKRKYITHTTLHYSQSAIQTFVGKQIFFLSLLLALAAFGFIIHPITTLQIIVGILSFIYFTDVLFNLYLILKSLHFPQEITFSKEELENIPNSSLPVYSILCPLYREAHVIPQFLNAIEKLDYPKNKLDVLLLLEEDDRETIEKVKQMELPKFVRPVIVPHSMPKTKPKACNYGLTQAKGEYLVIFDAEDIPDPLQLKKAYLGFQKVGKNVLCLQAKLNYYNPNQNLLTRFFTAEYSLWFDVTLTGLQSINTSIPLGGTSNHFRTRDLYKLQGWDPFNVTEDADLGIRLFKEGYQTAMIDSTTMEEANSKLGNWLRQRSRWIKGYMQTYLVHTRENISFFKKSRWHALIFHLVVGGKIAFILINPFLWIMTIAYFALYAYFGPAIEKLYPTVIFYMAAISLAFGNFLFLYYYMIGCAKRGQWELIKYVYLVPLYWLMISIAGAMAFYQLIFKPHYWEKTVHGLHLKKSLQKAIPEMVVAEGDSWMLFPKAFRNKLIKLITSKKAYIGGAALVLASMSANVLNFIYNAYLGRILELRDFALISLTGGFLSFASILFGAFTTTVNYKSGFLIGKYGEDAGYNFWRYIRRKSIIFSIAISVLWVILIPLTSRFFETDDIYIFVLFSLVLLTGLANGADRGYLSAKLMFGSLAVINIIDPIVRLATVFVLLTLALKHYTYSAISLAIFGTFITGWLLIVKQVKLNRKPLNTLPSEIKHFSKKFFLASLITGFSSITFVSMDIVLANHYLGSTEAGKYALLTLVGKMVYFLGGLTTPFIVPIISRNEGANKNSKKTLSVMLLATFLLAFVGFISFGVLGRYSIPILYGKKSLSIVSFLPFFAFGMMCFTVSKVLTNYYLVKKIYTFTAAGVVLGIAQFVGITLFHQDVKSIALVMFGIWTLHLITMGLLHVSVNSVKSFENNFVDFIGLFIKQKKKYTVEENKLKILIFNWRDTRHVWAGGAESYVHEIAKRWVKKGNHVTVFCGNDGKHPRNEVIDGVQIVRRGGFYTVYMWAALYYIFRFRGLFDAVVDSENGVPFFTPLYVRKPIFLLIHHVHQEVHRKHLKFPLYFVAMFLEGKLMPFLYRNKTIITVSDSSKTEVLKLGFGKKDTIDIVHPGIDITAFERKEKTAYPSFIYLGRLKPWKNVDVAIKAFATFAKNNTSAKLKIAGTGESLPGLQKLAHLLKIADQVEFLGRVSEKEKNTLLAQSWVALQPSMIEGWGITVIEANASGTPVVASDVNGLRDSILDGKTGILVKTRDVLEFSNAMQKLMKEEEFRKNLSNNAYFWSRSFSWDRSADNFYNRILFNLSNNSLGTPLNNISVNSTR